MKHHKIKYPKLLLLLIVILLAVVLFYEGKNYEPIHNFLISLGYWGTFLAGIFYAYGFTAAPATAVLLVLATEQQFFISVLVAGIGALISDVLIFTFIRHSFTDEIENLKNESLIRRIDTVLRKVCGRIYAYLLPILAGILIASPLPTEIGVTILSSIKHISIRKFMIIAYVLHTLGICIVLTIGSTL